MVILCRSKRFAKGEELPQDDEAADTLTLAQETEQYNEDKPKIIEGGEIAEGKREKFILMGYLWKWLINKPSIWERMENSSPNRSKTTQNERFCSDMPLWMTSFRIGINTKEILHS